jgi:hypothetical protein
MIEMIVKYLDDGVWSYIDNVRQVTNQYIDCEELIKRYDEMPCDAGTIDGVCYMNGEKLLEDICISNKVFHMATAELGDIGDSHAENLINGKEYMLPAYVILLYLNDYKEYDTLVLITNQRCFLMNDKGQTIERLV